MNAFDTQLNELRRQQKELEAEMAIQESQHKETLDAIAAAYLEAPGVEHDAFDAGHHGGGLMMPTAADTLKNGTTTGKLRPASATPETRTDMLKRYFDAMTDYPDYQQRRQERLQDVRPFRFQYRELQRPKSTATRKTEEEAQRREEAMLNALNYRFVAKAVPPSTFLNKYELMVEEWCARKEAIRLIAEEKARHMKEEDRTLAFSQEFARRKEEAGMPTSRTRSERRGGDWRVPPKPFKAREVPDFVRKTDVEAFKQAEMARAARIRFRAEQMLRLANEACAKTCRRSRSSTTNGKDAVAAATTASPSAPPTGTAPPAVAAAEARSPAKASTSKRSSSTHAAAELQKYNPNFTFQPKLKKEVPDFAYLWAKDKVALAAKKQQRPPTTAKPFDLARGRDTTCRIEKEILAEEETAKETRWPFMSKRGKVGPSPPPPAPSWPHPVGTKAHAVASEAHYLRIVEMEKELLAAKEEKRQIRDKQRKVAERVLKYIPEGSDVKALHAKIDAATATKLEQSRAEAKERYKALKARLKEIRDLPPVFMEPTHLFEAAKARALTTQQVLDALKEHGVSDATVAAILKGKSGAGSGTGASADVTMVQATDLGNGVVNPAASVQPSSLATQQAGVVVSQPTAAVAPPSAARRSSSSSSDSSSDSSSSSSSSDSD